jgi:hypothetical protein
VLRPRLTYQVQIKPTNLPGRVVRPISNYQVQIEPLDTGESGGQPKSTSRYLDYSAIILI